MKIGILVRDFSELRNWELRIIDHLRKSPDLELSLLIRAGSLSNLGEQARLPGSKGPAAALSRKLLVMQAKIEARFKKFKERRTVNTDDLGNYLSTIATLDISPRRVDGLDEFPEEAIERIKSYDLDLILKLAFQGFDASLGSASRYGIWSFQHVMDTLTSGCPAGFWEVLEKRAVISAVLLQLGPDAKSSRVIDQAFYNISFSYVRNQTKMAENAVILLFKNLKRLQENPEDFHLPAVEPPPPAIFPSIFSTLRYLSAFYLSLVEKTYRAFQEKLFKARFDCWTLFIGEGDFFNSQLSTLKPAKLPPDEYWADPFLFEHEGEKYIFFENFSYSKHRGKISCGKVKNGLVEEVVDVLVKPYHMSYPFIFREEGEIYLMPEMNQNKCLEIYRCVEFPQKWELYAKAFDDIRVADTTYYRDETGQRWLFLNKQMDDLGMGYCSELYIYQIDSLKLDGIRPHRQNPVLLDARIARGAGPIFKHEDRLIRPSQNNSRGIYGFGLNLNVIKKLNLEEYEEEKIMDIEPNFGKGIISIHHLHQVNGNFVVDAAFSKY